MRTRNEISVLVPAYEEGRNLPELVTALKKTLSSENSEIIIINDGNSDESFEVIKGLETEYSGVKGLFSNIRRGKTKAIKDGFKATKGDIVVILDADLQYSSGDIHKLIAALDYADVANGLRVHRKDNALRKIESRVYNSLVGLLFHVALEDCNSGFKVFKRKVLEETVGQLRDGWHRYLLVLAIKKGYHVVEVPIRHNPRKKGQSKFSSSPLKLIKGFADLLSVKMFVSQHKR
jgi:glycosyltransferase involved in cell wall biosynthesis